MVAVSGGVDSVVLLDLLKKQPGLDLIVAHFDHGIRADSHQDAEFVQKLADQSKLSFESRKGKLGAEASEDMARQARYKFLHEIKKKYSAMAIITAHHQDDVVETAIINLLRGTYRKGLSSLGSDAHLIRPMLNLSKEQITDYAKKQNLNWREDPTNTDTRFLRNYVRHRLLPAMTKVDANWKSQIMQHVDRARLLNRDINDALSVLAADNVKTLADGSLSLPRNWLIMLPIPIGREVLLHTLQRLGGGQINSQQLERALIFCKTARSGKQMEFGAGLVISVDNKTVNIA